MLRVTSTTAVIRTADRVGRVPSRTISDRDQGSLELPPTIDGRTVLIKAFVRAIETGTDLPISGTNNLPSLAMMMAAVQSAQRGESVTVTTDADAL